MKHNYPKKIASLVLVFAIWLILDRVAKAIVSSHSVGEKLSDSILGLFHITYVQNTGAAFGLFANNPIPLAVFSILIFVSLIVLYLWQLKRLKQGTSQHDITCVHTLSLGVVAAGGLSNAIDRIVHNYVIDYICLDFIEWPVFNIADIGITCGLILLVIVMFVGINKSNRKNTEAK